MERLRLCCVLTLAVVASTGLSAQEREVSQQLQAIHPSQRTLAQADSAPQLIMEELQGIVVLCATEPESMELKQSWIRYVQKHVTADTDIDALVKDVKRRTNAWRRAMYRQTPKQSPQLFGTLSNVAKMLHDTAKAVISNVR